MLGYITIWQAHPEKGGPTLMAIKFMVKAISQVADFISREMARTFLQSYVDAVIAAMLTLSKDALRGLEKPDLEEIINSVATLLRRTG